MGKVIRRFLMKLFLEKAISLEEHAYRFYESALEKAAMGDSADLLKRLLAEELRHRLKLEEVQRRGDIAALSVSQAPEERNIAEMAEEWPDIHPWASREEILQYALSRETGAYQFYKELAQKSPLKAVQDIFEALSKEELSHIDWLQKEMEKTVS